MASVRSWADCVGFSKCACFFLLLQIYIPLSKVEYESEDALIDKYTLRQSSVIGFIALKQLGRSQRSLTTTARQMERRFCRKSCCCLEGAEQKSPDWQWSCTRNRCSSATPILISLTCLPCLFLSSHLCTVRSAQATKTSHRWAKRISRSWKSQTVRALLAVVPPRKTEPEASHTVTLQLAFKHKSAGGCYESSVELLQPRNHAKY